jgi:membrane fusion protein, macrolide-specific efflux system
MRWWILVMSAVAIAAAVSGWRQVFHGQATPGMRLVEPRLDKIEQIVSAVGTIKPFEEVEVGTLASGQLKVVSVRLGDRVEKGQLLATIDPLLLQASVGANEAQLKGLQALLDDRIAGRSLAERQLERQTALGVGRATSLDAAEVADTNVSKARAEVRQIEAKIEEKKAELSSDKVKLGFTSIRAPLTGTVVAISAREGQIINASQLAPTIMKLANLQKMTVWSNVSETDVPRLQIGGKARFSTLGAPDVIYEGMLRSILPIPEVINGAVVYQALFDVPNPNGNLLAQMSAQVTFILAKVEKAIVLPREAVCDSGNGQGEVLVLNADQLSPRTVTLGLSTRTLQQIVSGLDTGTKVAVLDTVSLPGWTCNSKLGVQP